MWDQRRVVLTVARDATLARIELAYLGFNMAEYATWIAILVYGYAIGGVPMTGFVAMIQLIPAGVVAPFAAYAGDRFRKDRVLLAGYLLLSLTFALTAIALYAAAPALVTILAATSAAAAITIVRPAQSAILPAITHSPIDLTAANAVSGLSQSVGNLAGPLIAGCLLLRSQPGAVFAAFSLVALVGGVLVAGVPAVPEAIRPAATGDGRHAWRHAVGQSFAGFGVLRRERQARLIVVVLAAATVVWGAIDVLYVAVAIDLLHAGEAWAGFLSAATGVGGIAGAVGAVALVGRRRLTPAIASGGAVYGLPLAVIGPISTLAVTPVLFALSGAGDIVSSVAGRTLLQRVAPEAVLSRIFGVLEGLAMLTMAAGSLFAGLLAGWLGVPMTLLIVGLFVPLVLVAAWRPLAAIDTHARAPDQEALSLLRRLPVFAPVSAPSMERILAAVDRLDVPADEIIVRQGDAGERFYVIAVGRVEVTIDGTVVSERGPGDGFGEIALLRNVPRTATVRAMTDVRLLALDREPFLAAVTGHPQSEQRARALADAQLAHAAPSR